MCGVDVNNTGTIINAFFGFCDIRNFTDLTEVLQADVVKVVNNVGRIIHGNVTKNHGAPNKNIGDAFLVSSPPHPPLPRLLIVYPPALFSSCYHHHLLFHHHLHSSLSLLFSSSSSARRILVSSSVAHYLLLSLSGSPKETWRYRR